jgi:hypothetical protein
MYEVEALVVIFVEASCRGIYDDMVVLSQPAALPPQHIYHTAPPPAPSTAMCVWVGDGEAAAKRLAPGCRAACLLE